MSSADEPIESPPPRRPPTLATFNALAPRPAAFAAVAAPEPAFAAVVTPPSALPIIDVPTVVVAKMSAAVNAPNAVVALSMLPTILPKNVLSSLVLPMTVGFEFGALPLSRLRSSSMLNPVTPETILRIERFCPMMPRPPNALCIAAVISSSVPY